MAIQAHLYPYPSNTGFPLCVSQDLMMDLNSQQLHGSSVKHQQQTLEQQQRLQQLYNERQRNQNMSVIVNPTLLLANSSNAFNTTTNNNYNTNNLLSMPISQSLAVELENHKGEVDHYIRSQASFINEKLRIMLQEQRKQQVAALLKNAELDALRMLSQKDEQIAQAAKKRAELEEFLRRLEAENLSWRRVAQENEAMVLSLHNTLEQIKERSSYCHNNNNNNNNGAEREDAESCCGESRRNMATEEGRGENRVPCVGEGDAQQVSRTTMVCRSCNSRSSCFMFLPCRHLCSCKACEAFLEACPACRMPKKSSIEALLF